MCGIAARPSPATPPVQGRADRLLPARLIPEGSSGRYRLRRAREFLTEANAEDAEMYAAWVEYFSPLERRAFRCGPGTAPIPPGPIPSATGRHEHAPAAGRDRRAAQTWLQSAKLTVTGISARCGMSDFCHPEGDQEQTAEIEK